MFDGWTSSGTHFVALFAVFKPTTALPEGGILLVFSRFEDEIDLSAQSMSDFIADTLEEFERPWESVMCLVSDNCNVNQYLGDHGGIPFIGCASHRFNLGVKLFLKAERNLLDKANELMRKLTSIKGRAALKKKTHLHAKIRNDTRWSSTYEILDRCVKLLPAIRSLDPQIGVRCGVQELVLSIRDGIAAEALLEDMKKLQSVTLELQKEDLTMEQVRTLFDYTLEFFPIMKKYISPTCDIVNDPFLEKGLVKI